MKALLILEALKKVGKTTDALLNIFMGGHQQWYRETKRKVFYPTMPSHTSFQSKQLIEREKHNFYSLLYQLKKQGFIQRSRKDNKSQWALTREGEKKLQKMKNVYRYLPKSFYKKEKDGGLNIFIFDIPEKEKPKRDWLRRSLLSLDFSLLQKSVWIGQNKLPAEFLEDLEELKLMDYIHIFKATKTGTLRYRFV